MYSEDVPGDLDGDGHVDIGDVDLFGDCMNGPDVAPPGGCTRAKLDGDSDVDLADFAEFQRVYAPW